MQQGTLTFKPQSFSQSKELIFFAFFASFQISMSAVDCDVRECLHFHLSFHIFFLKVEIL